MLTEFIVSSHAMQQQQSERRLQLQRGVDRGAGPFKTVLAFVLHRRWERVGVEAGCTGVVEASEDREPRVRVHVFLVAFQSHTVSRS